MSKKLPQVLQKLLEEHKQAWAVDEQELAKRIESAKINYEKRYPTIGDTENNAQILISRVTWMEFLEELHQVKWNDYTIDHSRSQGRSGLYRAFMIKPQALQEQDLKRITQTVTEAYMQSLDAVKQEYIENLLHEYEEQQAEARAAKEKEKQAKLREQLLSMID